MLVTYEKTGFFGKIIRFLLLPLVSIPLVGNFLFVKLSNLGRKIKKLAATYRALEIIYTYSWKKTTGKGIIERVITHILLHFWNAKAVRNRLKLTKEELGKAISSHNGENFHIMSLGCGSARAVIESLTEDISCNGAYTVTLVDRSRSALRYSRKLAEENKISGNLVLVQGLLGKFIENGRNHAPDIVEIVGIFDYFEDDAMIKILSEVYNLLAPGGVLITCNIRDNPERLFLTRVLKWPMIYREPEEFSRILTEAGFDSLQIRPEPLGIHTLAIAKKNKNP